MTENTSDVRGNRPSVQSRVMQYFEKHPNVNIYLNELSAAIGESDRTVQSGVTNVRKRPEWRADIEVVVQGNQWIYRPHATRAQIAAGGARPPVGPGKVGGQGRIFEEIGVTREGHLIIQGDDGGIYRAQEL